MNAQTLLEKIHILELQIERIAMKRDSLRSLAESVTTVIRGTNVSGSHNDRKLEDLLNESAELDRKIAVLQDELVDRKLEFVQMLDAMKNPAAARITVLRLLEKKSWQSISETVGYSSSHCRLLCTEILEKLSIDKH